jgi:hypothetical protein
LIDANRQLKESAGDDQAAGGKRVTAMKFGSISATTASFILEG